jgi:hypothetical protein
MTTVLIIGTLPYTISNGNPTDAVPVMANFNYIVSQINTNLAFIVSAGGPTASRPTSPYLYQHYWDTTYGFDTVCTQLSPQVWETTSGVVV